MKKELSVRVLFFIGITTIFMGCQDDIGDKPPKTQRSLWDWFSDSDAADISNAREWYQQNGAQAVKTKAGQHPLFDEMVPYWQETYVRKDRYCKTVEVALNARRRRKFIDGMCSMMYEESRDQKYLQSLTRLIIKTDLKTNKVQGFFMTIVPSLQYLQDCQFKPFIRNTYTERDRNFDGYIYYHELNGEYANGWKYTDGMITHTMQPADGDRPSTRAMT